MNGTTTERTDIVIALNAAIAESKMPFGVFDATFFDGDAPLKGKHYVFAESTESEYAIVIQPVQMHKDVPTLAGTRYEPYTGYKIWYPVFERGDGSVGLDDAWYIDFEETEPDFTASTVTGAAIHTVNWFRDREMAMRIDADLYQHHLKVS